MVQVAQLLEVPWLKRVMQWITIESKPMVPFVISWSYMPQHSGQQALHYRGYQAYCDNKDIAKHGYDPDTTLPEKNRVRWMHLISLGSTSKIFHSRSSTNMFTATSMMSYDGIK